MKRWLSILILALPVSAQTTSYANPLGTGNRLREAIVTFTGITFAGTPSSFLDGVILGADNRMWWSGSVTSSVALTFDFGDSSYVIDEAKFYQSTSDTHGTWLWQGSNDGSSWTDIGSSFTVGGSTAQTMTSMNGNTTAYKQYRLRGVSGTATGSPWIRQLEFKVSTIVSRDGGGTTSYSNSGGSGDRTGGSVVVTSTGISATDEFAFRLVDGTRDSQFGNIIQNPSTVGSELRFDFGTPKVVDEICMFTSFHDSSNTGTFSWQGSNNGTVWTDLQTGFIIITPSGSGGSSPSGVQIFRGLHGNTTAFRFIRLVVTTGNSTSSPNLSEFEFRLAAGAVQRTSVTIY